MIEVFGKPDCTGCTSVKMLLEMKSKTYTYHDLTSPDVDPEAAARFRAIGLQQVPQVLIDGVHVGGYEELKEHIKL